MEFNHIAYFQFNNLLQSRIPMVLVLLDEVPLASWYNSVVRMHLEIISLQVDAKEAVKAVVDKKLPPHYAVVVLDLDESKSPAVAQELEALGMLNAYYVKGGWQGISAEKAHPDK